MVRLQAQRASQVELLHRLSVVPGGEADLLQRLPEALPR